MYTVIPRREPSEHQPETGEPKLEVIDHRKQDRKSDRWKNRRRQEQLPYDSLKGHRDALLNNEFKYKHRIKELEKQNADIAKTYEETYHENKVLKSIIEHGPDAAKMKQLQVDKKEQKGYIEQLEEENRDIREKFKELERIYGAPQDILLEKNWKEALAKARRKREEEDAIPTQGPFAGAKLFKKKRVKIDDMRPEDQDSYDLALDNLEKETQIVLNKVRQLKREKDKIDYALLMGKGAVSRNVTVATAIDEKLNRDLNKFAIKLETLKLKHKAAKEFHERTTRDIDMEAVQRFDVQRNSEKRYPQTERLDRSAQSPKTMQSTNGPNDATDKGYHSDSERSNKAPKTSRQHKSGGFGPKTSTPSTTKTSTSANTNFKSNKPQKNGQTDKPPSPIEANQSDENTRAATRRQKGDKKVPLSKNRVHSKSNPALESVGRFTHGPEPIGRRQKSDLVARTKDTDGQTTEQPNDSSDSKSKIPAIAFPFKRKSAYHHTCLPKEENYESVLENLRRTNERNLAALRESRDHVQVKAQTRNDRYSILSPQPLQFNMDGRMVTRNEMRQIMGNTGVRSDDYFYRYV